MTPTVILLNGLTSVRVVSQPADMISVPNTLERQCEP